MQQYKLGVLWQPACCFALPHERERWWHYNGTMTTTRITVTRNAQQEGSAPGQTKQTSVEPLWTCWVGAVQV
jgi:hypothetical protein